MHWRRQWQPTPVFLPGDLSNTTVQKHQFFCTQPSSQSNSQKVAQSCPTLSDPRGLSMEFFRPEYWSGEPFPSPGDLPNPGIEPRSPILQAESLPAAPLPPSPLSALEGRGPGSPACSCPSKPHVFTEQGSGLCGCRGQAVGADASPQVPTLGNRGGPDGAVLLPSGWRGGATEGSVDLNGGLSLLLRGPRSSGSPHPPGGQASLRAAEAEQPWRPWSQGPRAGSGAAS